MADAGAGGHNPLDGRDAQADANRQQQHVEQSGQRLHIQPVGVGLVDRAGKASAL